MTEGRKNIISSINGFMAFRSAYPDLSRGDIFSQFPTLETRLNEFVEKIQSEPAA